MESYDLISLARELDDLVPKGHAVDGYWLDFELDSDELAYRGSYLTVLTGAGATYCLKHARLVSMLLRDGLGDDKLNLPDWDSDDIDAGIRMLDSEGEDSTKFCDVCSQLLDTPLTTEGADAEIEHYEENPPDIPLSNRDAWYLARLVEAHAWAGDDVRDENHLLHRQIQSWLWDTRNHRSSEGEAP